MEQTTLQQLEQLREETRVLERQNKALPAFLCITFIPIIIICVWVIFPEDSRGIIFVGKLWVAGILIGLMVCGYIATALGLTKSFRTYWPSLTCGLAAIIPLIIATASHAKYGLPLVQFSVSFGVIACGLGQYYYLVKIGTSKPNFNAHFIHAFIGFMVLYSQLEAGVGIAQNFPMSVAGQVLLCAFYPFFSALFRRLCILVVPASGRVTSEILSIYIASMTYRILTVYYYKNWGVFTIILVLDLVFKWIFYSCQLTDGYLVIKKRLQNSIKRIFSFPSRLQRYIHLEDDEENEEFIPLPLDKERETHHKEISLYFFLQTHADLYFGIGLAFVQLTAMKLVSHDETVNCFSDFWSDFIDITIMYGLVAIFQIINMTAFYFFATKILKKETFSPVAEGTASLSRHLSSILFTSVALYLFVFILFFHSYAGKSVYCPEND